MDGGLSPSASKVIANAIANAATPQFAKARDIADATPTDQLRLIDGETRKYLLTNLDYSSESPYQSRLQSSPGQYVGGQADHPYKGAQPVTPVPPLSKDSVKGGAFVSVDNSVQDGAPISTVSLNIGGKSGPHLRLNTATQALDAVNWQFASPQGLVTATLDEQNNANRVELVVRKLGTTTVVQDDGQTKGVLGWTDSTVSPTTVFTQWAKNNLFNQTNASGLLTAIGAPALSSGSWTPTISATTTPPTLVYDTTNTQGRWVKIGPLVWITGRVIISSVTAAGSGVLSLGNFPFAVSNVGGNANLSVGSIGYKTAWVTTGPTFFYFVNGTSTGVLTVNAGATISTLTGANLGAGTDVIFSGWYLSA